MISLKQVHEHAEAEKSSYRDSAYGYGTEIYLDGEQVEALGIQEFRAGQQVMIRALAVVKRSTEELEPGDDSGGKDTSLCIQITDLEVEAKGGVDTKKAASMLYGEDE
jgi:hypothetical protein